MNNISMIIKHSRQNMNQRVRRFLYAACLLSVTTVHAAELSGRFSMLGSTARASQGDAGYINKDKTLTADQQSLRLMLEEASNNSEWSLHLKMARIHLSGLAFDDSHSSDLFRYDKLSANWLEENDSYNATRFGYEIDRAVYKQQYKNTTLALGRQPIDWGSGRFWQPFNVFGAFAPTDLDTDFKPGIDAARLDWFPSNFSSLTAVYAFSAKDNVTVDNKTSAAVHYRRQVGELSELALLAGGVIGNRVLGASFESTWAGIGWRIEGVQYNFTETNENSLFWIAGIDYQFNNGTLLAAEWYDNSRGANNITALTSINSQTDSFIKYGLQQQLSQNVLGISLSKDLTPLLRGTYILLASPLKEVDNKLSASLLHQFNLTYSVSNESDILFSLQLANGQGLSATAKPQSEFGHLPAAMSVRLRFYF